MMYSVANVFGATVYPFMINAFIQFTNPVYSMKHALFYGLCSYNLTHWRVTPNLIGISLETYGNNFLLIENNLIS